MEPHFSPYTTPVTAQFGDHLAHQVSDQDVYQHGDSGAVRAMCGKRIVPAPMMSPTGEPCTVCEAQIGYRPPSGPMW